MVGLLLDLLRSTNLVHLTLHALQYLGFTITIYISYRISRSLYEEWTLPLRVLPGPPNSSWVYGNLREIWNAENSALHEKWVEEYGSTIIYRTFGARTRLYTVDTKALTHILMNTSIYQKPEPTRFALTQMLGPGVLVVEGDKHKQQRRIMNPAFGNAQVRELTDIFLEKAIQLRDIWGSIISDESEQPAASIDVLSWLSKMTLDVIGLAGFNYHFDALTTDAEGNELNRAFSTMFNSEQKLNSVRMLRAVVPELRFLPDDRDSETTRARSTMHRIGRQLMEESKAGILEDNAPSRMAEKTVTTRRNRDLLSLLLRANMSKDLPANQRMSDEDVLAQVPTFLIAGHETTSTATTWALYALTQNPAAQSKLRKEVLCVATDHPSMDDLNSLPYLDAVVRETLRVHAPVPTTLRMAVKDDILPLSEPIRGRDGKILDRVPVSKGQTLMISLLAMNRLKSIWGEDSFEFKPERWENPPLAASALPGVWGNMLSFLGGPRACIGYRFSLIEIKVLLFTLIRTFEFELAVPPGDIIKKSSLIQRPLLRTDLKAGNQMPLILRPVHGVV